MVLFVRGKEWLQCKYGKSVQPEERAGPTVFSLRGSSSTWSFHPQLPRVYVCVHPSCVTLESGTFSPDVLTLGQVDVGGKDQMRCLCKHALYAPRPRCWGHLLVDTHLKSTVTLCIYHNTVYIKHYRKASPSSIRCMNKHIVLFLSPFPAILCLLQRKIHLLYF